MNIDDINTATQGFVRLIRPLLSLLRASCYCVNISGDYLEKKSNLIWMRPTAVSLLGLCAGDHGEREQQYVFPL